MDESNSEANAKILGDTKVILIPLNSNRKKVNS